MLVIKLKSTGDSLKFAITLLCLLPVTHYGQLSITMLVVTIGQN